VEAAQRLIRRRRTSERRPSARPALGRGVANITTSPKSTTARRILLQPFDAPHGEFSRLLSGGVEPDMCAVCGCGLKRCRIGPKRWSGEVAANIGARPGGVRCPGITGRTGRGALHALQSPAPNSFFFSVGLCRARLEEKGKKEAVDAAPPPALKACICSSRVRPVARIWQKTCR